MRPFRVNAYMKAIPPGNKNPEKPQLLHNFIEGVCRVGDKGSIIDTYQYEPADVGVLQGFVHQRLLVRIGMYQYEPADVGVLQG